MRDAVVEEIDSSRYGNPLLTRGAFGEITVALFSDNCEGRSDSEPNRVGGRTWKYAAVKTIRKALIAPKPSGGGQGPWGLSSSAAASWGFAASGGPAGAAAQSSGTADPAHHHQLTGEAFCELAALRALSGHPRVARLLAAYPSRDALGLSGAALSLAFPYCPVDLADAIARRRGTLRPGEGRFRDGVVRAVIGDVLSGMDHCHSNGVLHGDIKPGNFLVGGEGRIQLADFGLAEACPSAIREAGAETSARRDGDVEDTDAEPRDGSVPRALCTLHYRPPETLYGSAARAPAVDVWGAGLVLAELLNVRALFPGRNAIDQMSVIFAALGTPGTPDRWPEAGRLPDFDKVRFDSCGPRDWEELVPRSGRCGDLRNLLGGMIALDPNRRLTARECLSHAWVSQNAGAATPKEIVAELVPDELRVPPVLLVDDSTIGNAGSDREGLRPDCFESAKRRAVEMAATRRSFTMTNHTWSHNQGDSESSCASNADARRNECKRQMKDNGLVQALASLV